VYSEKTCFAGQTTESSGNAQKQKKKRKAEDTFLGMRKGRK
jgi:hypothetical protein